MQNKMEFRLPPDYRTPRTIQSGLHLQMRRTLRLFRHAVTPVAPQMEAELRSSIRKWPIAVCMLFAACISFSNKCIGGFSISESHCVHLIYWTEQWGQVKTRQSWLVSWLLVKTEEWNEHRESRTQSRTLFCTTMHLKRLQSKQLQICNNVCMSDWGDFGLN